MSTVVIALTFSPRIMAVEHFGQVRVSLGMMAPFLFGGCPQVVYYD
jgi:hypothetical protein